MKNFIRGFICAIIIGLSGCVGGSGTQKIPFEREQQALTSALHAPGATVSVSEVQTATTGNSIRAYFTLSFPSGSANSCVAIFTRSDDGRWLITKVTDTSNVPMPIFNTGIEMK